MLWSYVRKLLNAAKAALTPFGAAGLIWGILVCTSVLIAYLGDSTLENPRLTQAAPSPKEGREPQHGSMPAKKLSLRVDGAPRSLAHALSFAGCREEAFDVDYLDALDAMPDDTLEEQLEQLRDWLWLAVLGRLAEATSADEILSGNAEQALLRDATLSSGLSKTYGPTRAVTTQSGEVIVLVERADSDVMAERALEAIDEEALFLGHAPANARVFQYELMAETARARVCLVTEWSRSFLESEAAGFRKANVDTTEELEEFLAGGVDLLGAQCGASGVDLVGRRRARASTAPMTLEHVATVVGRSEVAFVPPETLGISMSSLGANERAWIETTSSSIDRHLRPGSTEPPIKATESWQAEAIHFAVGWKRQHSTTSTRELLLSAMAQVIASSSLGFSLDPRTDMSAVRESLDAIIAALPSARALAELIDDWPARPKQLVSVIEVAVDADAKMRERTRAALVELRDKLRRADPTQQERLLLEAARKPAPDAPPLATFLAQIVEDRAASQRARYDGGLQGTSVGMTLFYTDLLAKAWSFNWNDGAPEAFIPGFESSVHHPLSADQCDEENKLSNGRLWFGPRPTHFTRESSAEIRFGPILATIFARGSELGAAHGAESDPAPSLGRFIQWWDGHYRSVAEWEPQYELLNQIMKWSMVAQSAATQTDRSCFHFLHGVKVDESHRFDRWVEARSDLKWRGPVSLLPGDPREPERLRRLSSATFTNACAEEMWIEGGVSLPSRSQVLSTGVRTQGVPAALRKLSVTEAPVMSSGGARFASLPRSGGKLTDVVIQQGGRGVRFQATLEGGASSASALWSTGGAPRNVVKSLELSSGRLVAQQKAGSVGVAKLTVADLKAASPKLLVDRSTALSAKIEAQALAKMAALDSLPFSKAARRFAVTRPAHVLNDGSVVIRLGDPGGKGTYAVLSSAGSRGPPAAAESSFRVAAATKYAAPADSVVHVSIINNASAETLLAAHKLLPPRAPDAAATTNITHLRRALQALDTKRAEAIARSMAKNPARYGDDYMLDAIIEQERALLARQGGDTSQLSAIAIRPSKRPAPSAVAKQHLSDFAATGDGLVYAPKSYPATGRLPPTSHPLGRVLAPNERYISHVTAEVYRVEGAPKMLSEVAPGNELLLQSATSSGSAQVLSLVGSPHRLLSWGLETAPIIVVDRCNAGDGKMEERGLPPCYDLSLPSMDNVFSTHKAELIEALLKCDADTTGVDSRSRSACTQASVTKVLKDAVTKGAARGPGTPESKK